jgi:hypothetical protein
MVLIRYLKLSVKLAVVALVVSTAAVSAKAQNAYQGRFTLPVEAHWGSAALQAGDYTVTLPSNSAPYRFYIQGDKVSAIIQVSTAEPGSVSKSSKLDLVDIADGFTVKTFDVPQLALRFTYSMPAQERREPREAQHKGTPQTLPPSPVGANEMPIAVHTHGR